MTCSTCVASGCQSASREANRAPRNKIPNFIDYYDNEQILSRDLGLKSRKLLLHIAAKLPQSFKKYFVNFVVISIISLS